VENNLAKQRRALREECPVCCLHPTLLDLRRSAGSGRRNHPAALRGTIRCIEELVEFRHQFRKAVAVLFVGDLIAQLLHSLFGRFV